ncbi:MAG: glycosyltransferase [Clostridiales bacterium]|nr:glycosyltransferase [Clostridiales bacterium]
MKIQQIRKKYKKCSLMSYYTHYYYQSSLHNKDIFFESKNSADLGPNMIYLLKELQHSEYSDYRIFLSVLKNKKEYIFSLLKSCNLSNIHLVEANSKQYYKCLATCKYLFTDTTFAQAFVKKEGQILTNTWHGTPLKCMGREVQDRAYAIGNVQRTLLYSDYLVYPNDYMKEKMVDSYMLRGLYQGTILCEGYPRNSVFYEPEYGKDIRKELGIEKKQVFMYMPTWRGTITNKNTSHLYVVEDFYLTPLDQQLTDDQIFYVKLHPFMQSEMDFSKYRHIRPFPEQYESYAFLSICDCLVTDYSSVFYDFANSRNKIILFAYDEAEYLKDRGLYVDLKSLPFPIVKTVEDLVRELNSPKTYEDGAFIKEYCTYDGPGAAKRICQQVILNQSVCVTEKLRSSSRNSQDASDGIEEKPNVLLYGSSLDKNGLTTSLLNLFDAIDLNKRNYYVSFSQFVLKKAPLRVGMIPKEVGILPIASDINPTLKEKLAHVLYFKWNKDSKWIEKYLNRLYEREWQKNFGGAKIDYAIEYAGYGKDMIKLYQSFHGPRCIFVHNDMVKELKTKTNQHALTLQSAYQNYDTVAVVTKDIIPPTVSISQREDNIKVVNNCHAYQAVRDKALKEIQFDDITVSNVTLAELVEYLHSDRKILITIGRFSSEKNHMMLMKAYERLSQEYPNTCLIIIGGYGPLADETMNYANSSKADIIVIKGLQNPMPILKRADFFVLSSTYEGLGLTLLEADSLGIPTISTDIPGPRGFVKDHGGVLVEVSEDGLLSGMKDFMEGIIQPMNVDYEKYNQEAVKQFERLFEVHRR